VLRRSVESALAAPIRVMYQGIRLAALRISLMVSGDFTRW
jgi:hypothetical protein